MKAAYNSFNVTKNAGSALRTLINITKAHAENGEYKTALNHARKCLSVARNNDYKMQLQNIYEIYWKIFDPVQNKDSAYFYFQKFVSQKNTSEDAIFKRQYILKLALFKVETKEEQQEARVNIL